MNGSWPAVVLVAAVLAASMAALSSGTMRRLVAAETGRKVLHVEMGLVSAAFPWIFASAWPVGVLAAVCIGWFAALRASSRLAGIFGAALHDCRRRSAGEVWFVCGVCLAFVLSAGEPLRYCVAILVLTFADAAAALVGQRIGRTRRMPGGARKSPAGSCAFFGVAFAVTAAGLHAAGGTPLAEAVRAGLVVAGATALVEALLGEGLDNLAVPLAALAALEACA